MIDQAFLPLHRALLEYAAIGKELQTADGGIRSYIYRFRVESPVELDVVWGADGKLELGTVPPLYDVATSIRPSIHRVRFTAEWTDWKEEDDGGTAGAAGNPRETGAAGSSRDAWEAVLDEWIPK